MKVVRVPDFARQYFTDEQLSGLPSWHCYSCKAEINEKKRKERQPTTTSDDVQPVKAKSVIVGSST